MAKQLLRNNSSFQIENDRRQGCMWGVLHFLNFQKRFRHRKMLLDGKRGGRKHGAGFKYSKLKKRLASTGDEHQESNSLANSQDAKEGQKQKVRPVSRQLMRTISIHHLECNDYVLPDGTSADNTDTESTAHSLEDDSPVNSGDLQVFESTSTINSVRESQQDMSHHEFFTKQALLQEKLKEAKLDSLNQRKTDIPQMKGKLGENQAQQAQQFLDALELFNANTEKFLKVLQDPNYLSANYIQDLKNSGESSILSKSSSFPGAGLAGKCAQLSISRRKNTDSQNIIPQSQMPPSVKSLKLKGDAIEDSFKPSEASIDTAGPHTSSHLSSSAIHELKAPSDEGTPEHRFKDLKMRMKDIIKEGKNDTNRIAMDGILDKIPYGHKISQDLSETGSVLARYGRKVRLGSDWTASADKSSHPHFRRSRSLTDSIERYSQLLRSTSNREFEEHVSARLTLVHEDGGLPDKTHPSRTFGRLYSLPEYESYFPSTNLSHVISSRTRSMDLDEANYSMNFNLSDERKLTGALTYPVKGADLSRYEDNKVLEHAVENTACTPDEVTDQCVAVRKDYQEPDNFPAENIGYNHSHDQETAAEMDTSKKPGKPSPISVLDVLYPEDQISPLRFSVLEEQLDCHSHPDHRIVLHICDDDESNKENFNKVQSMHETDLDDLNIQVDSKNEGEFSYVHDILEKSGLCSTGSLGSWYSPELPLNPNLFKELEGLSSETEICSLDADINLDHLLLFDLMNEALMEIYEASTALSPWLSGFDSHVRPMPPGSQVLKEVWANIRWHLGCQPHLNPKLDYLLSRDLTRNDGWMKLRYDIEEVGMELEEMILDDELDEVVLELLSSG